MKRRTRYILAAAGLLVVGLGGVAYFKPELIGRPAAAGPAVEAPDLATMTAEQAIAFVATDAFNRLSAEQRKAHLLGIVAKLKDRDIRAVVDLMMDQGKNEQDRKKFSENIRLLPEADRQAVGRAYFAMFLGKFYAAPREQQYRYLTVMALAEKTGGARERSREYGLPTPEKLKEGMASQLENMTPQQRAQFTQFMVDYARTRTQFGLKD